MYRKEREGYAIVASLKSCIRLKDVEKGLQLHQQIAELGFDKKDLFICSSLVHMYTKLGLLSQARLVFDGLTLKDAVTWNALISGYAYHGYGTEALICFERMRLQGFVPNAVTYTCSLTSCAGSNLLNKGKEIHSQIEALGLLDRDVILGNALVDMYAKCGSLYPAKQALEKLQGRDIFTWTALLAGYTEYGRDEELLECLKQIQAEGIPPNTVTFICSAKACTRVRDLNRGLELHCQIGRSGLLGKELALSNALVDMYIKCGFLAAAHEVFHTIRDKDVVSWSTLIVGCLDHGHNEEALIFLDKMLLQGILPSTVTIVSALTACGNLGAISKGHMLHAQIRNKACYVKDLVLGTTLVNMYAKCGSLIVAQRVFDDLQVQDAVLWTALIEGYADAGQGEMALTFYDKMQFEGVLPDAFTYICSLKACITVGAVEKGQELHAEIERLGLLDHHLFVGNIVVDMYAKCGRLLLAQQVFNRLPAREVDSWNPLLTGYALAGRHAVVFSIFECMMREHIRPDSVTFLVVLNACSTAGLCSRGHTYFEAMCNDFGIAPDFKHCLSLIDSFYRVGNFNGGAKVVEGVRPPSDDILQRIILSACKSCGCA